MEVRGFEPNKKRTKYNIRKFGYNDALALVFLVVTCATFYFISWANYDLIAAMFNYKDAITILR
jgi:energy-coupling factor transporter transmembrane protein EcfT